jgi:hypothetical protein
MDRGGAVARRFNEVLRCPFDTLRAGPSSFRESSSLALSMDSGQALRRSSGQSLLGTMSQRVGQMGHFETFGTFSGGQNLHHITQNTQIMIMRYMLQKCYIGPTREPGRRASGSRTEGKLALRGLLLLSTGATRRQISGDSRRSSAGLVVASGCNGPRGGA